MDVRAFLGNYVYLVPLFPLVAFVVIILLGKWLKEKISHTIAVGAIALSTVVSTGIFIEAVSGAYREALHVGGNWFTFGTYRMPFEFTVDNLSASMLFMVSLVSTMIQLFSTGYMKGDPRYTRFFAYLSLFCMAMLGLVVSETIFLFYIFWELMGLMSYLLIGFWFEKRSAYLAAKKAFLTTRVGDVCLFIGILSLFFLTGAFRFTDLTAYIGQHASEIGPTVLTVTGILVFMGAVGKSAQFPLHTWLPDAMEGPTPVSALIHAATMVAAGVYLVAKSYFIFEAAPTSMLIVGGIGAFTALFAATIGLVMNDIKRVLAYSTISQLGYMMAGLGVGGFAAGIFHLLMQGFIKALLFLSSGSVIIGCHHEQDMRKMGGLAKYMPITNMVFLIGVLSMAGIFPLSGFWSKDELIADAFRAGGEGGILGILIFLALLLGAFITALYMGRQYCMTFLGTYRGGEPHSGGHGHSGGELHLPKESPWNVTLPLVVLAVFAVLAGLFGSPLLGNWFQHFVFHGEEPHIAPFNILTALLSLGLSLLGLWVSYGIYVKGWKFDALYAKVRWYERVLQNKYYVDEIYDTVFVQPTVRLAGILRNFDNYGVDGLVNFSALLTRWFAMLSKLWDIYIVDGLVNGAAYIIERFNSKLKYLQSGYIQHYIMVIFFSVLMIVLALMFFNPVLRR